MHQRTDGNFGVNSQEQITVKVVKKYPVYAAAFSDPIHSLWDSVSQPDALTEVRRLTCPQPKGSMCAFGILFDFIGDVPQDDDYQVTFTGQTGAATKRTVFPPPLAHRTYTFIVE